jgi:hypothetical protein
MTLCPLIFGEKTMKNLKIDLGKMEIASTKHQADQVLKLFTVEPSFNNVYDENSYYFHQNEVLRFLLRSKNRNTIFDALGIKWVHKKFVYPELFINDTEVFSNILNGNINSALNLSDDQLQKYNLSGIITGKEFLKYFGRNNKINTKEKLNIAITLLKVTDNVPFYLENMAEPFFRYQFDDDFVNFVHACNLEGNRINIFSSNDDIKSYLEKVDIPYNGTPLLSSRCRLIKNEAELKRLSYDMNHNLLIHIEKMFNRRAFIFYLEGKFPTVFVVENFQGTNHFQISKAYGMDYTRVRKSEMQEMTEMVNMYENMKFFEANKPDEMKPEHKRELDALLNIL